MGLENVLFKNISKAASMPVVKSASYTKAINTSCALAKDVFEKQTGETLKKSGFSFEKLKSLFSGVFSKPKAQVISETLPKGISEESKEISNLILSKISEIQDPKIKAKSKDMVSAIEKAVKKGDEGALKRLETAFNVLVEKGEDYETIKRLSNEYAELLTSNGYTKASLQEVMHSLGLDGEIGKTKIGYISNGEFGTISARAKGETSILSKIRNKIVELKTDVPTSIDEVKELIGDAQGARFVISDAKITDETIESLMSPSINKADMESFLDYLKGKMPDIPSTKSDLFKEQEKVLLRKINRLQTAPYVDKMADSIKTGDLRITEIHNYSSKTGTPYLDGVQVKKLRSAYDEWFNSRLDAVKNGDKTYRLIQNGDTKTLIDKDGNLFNEILTVESVSDLNNKAFKSNGYTAAQFNLVTKSGQKQELQIRGSALDKMAECEHTVYDVKKGKDTVVGSEYDKIRAAIGKLNESKGARDEYDGYFNDVFKAFRKRELGFKQTPLPKISEYTMIRDYIKDENMLHTLSAEGIMELYESLHK